MVLLNEAMMSLTLIYVCFWLFSLDMSFGADFFVTSGFFASFNSRDALNVTSGFECVFRCTELKEYTCSFARYDHKTHYCKLYNWRDIRTLRQNDEPLDRGKWMYVALDRKIVYVNYMKEGFFYEEGKERCKRIGGVVASTEDLVKAADLGWWYCMCGYTNDTLPYYYMPTAKGQCLSGLHECPVQEYGVFCKF